MEELALNILDIACNSIAANATTVWITVAADTEKDLLSISVKDNGKGMDKEFLSKVTDPFATTRKTRKVGMGIPLFKAAAVDAGGEFSIESELGKGTETKATFKLSHIDRMPLGDLASSIVTLIGSAGNAEIVFSYTLNANGYVFDTGEIKKVLDGVDINSPEIIVYIKDMIDENITRINGGLIL